MKCGILITTMSRWGKQHMFLDIGGGGGGDDDDDRHDVDGDDDA